MTCGEALVRLLEAYGVDTVFGIPGVHNLELYRGLESSSIRHILTRHEQGAGFMADAYARASAKPGVCFVISGPGLTNIATPMGQAYSDSVAMLVISSDAPSETLAKGWGYLHEVTDLTAVSKPLTAFSATALRPEEVPRLLARAFACFTSQRPRPVHIAIPLDVLAMPVSENWHVGPPVAKARATSAELQKLADLLQEASRVVLIAGGGVIQAGATQVLQEFAESLDLMIALTSAGKGIVADEHPLCLGLVTQKAVQEVISSADLVLALGTELADTDCYAGHYKFRGKLIHIDIDPSKPGDYFPTDLGIVADLKDSLEALIKLTKQLDLKPKASLDPSRASIKEQLLSNLSPLERQHHKVLLALRQALPDDALICADMTQLAYSAVCLLAMPRAGCWFSPTGYGTLGYALPAAIGAKFAAPERTVVVLVGDAGFQYTLQELATAVEHKQALVLIVWNNAGLGEIERSMQAVNIKPLQVKPHNPDFQMLARAYGADAILAASQEAFIKAVRDSQTKDRPTLIELRQDQDWLLDA